MKALNIYLEDEEYKKLVKLKGKKTWREFILELTK
jgi:predicted CopG family antitoxin